MNKKIVDKRIYGGMLVDKYFFIFDDGMAMQVHFHEFEMYRKGDEYPFRTPITFDEAIKDIEEGKTVPLDTALNEEPPTESETFKKICKEIQELFDKIEALELHNHVLIVANEDLDKDLNDAREVFQTAMDLAKKYKDERDEYKIGHDRYEKLRRLSPMQFHELYEKNIKTGEHFDKLVDKL